MTRGATLSGLHLLVSAGPTYQDIDPVRFLGNRSSGKMGFAIAAAAAARGARVTLVAGPVALDTPDNVTRIDVRSAAQMHAAVLAQLPADIYIGAAAVADFTPRDVSATKLKKQAGQDNLTLQLVRTPDILAEVAAHPQRPTMVVGFAAETAHGDAELEAYARDKLICKRIDLIAANRVGVADSGFESDDNALTVFWEGGARALGKASKAQLAEALLDLIAQRMAAAASHV